MLTADGVKLSKHKNPRNVGDLGLQEVYIAKEVSDRVLQLVEGRVQELKTSDFKFMEEYSFKPTRVRNTVNRFLRRRNRDTITDAVLDHIIDGTTSAADVMKELNVDLEDIEYKIQNKLQKTLEELEQEKIDNATSSEEKQKAEFNKARSNLTRNKNTHIQQLKETCGQTSEDRVTRYLKSHRLGTTSYETEAQQKERPVAERNARTPDYLLKKPVLVNGQRVHWIDCKNAIMIPGACRFRELNRVLRQMNAYRDLFGPGLIIWNDVPPFQTMVDFLGTADLLHLHLPKKKPTAKKVKKKAPAASSNEAVHASSFEADCKARNDLLSHEQLARLIELLEQRLEDALDAP